MDALKFLADENVEKGIVDNLFQSGHDVKWVRDSDAGSNDERVRKLATKEKRILLTNDKGFGEMVFMQKRVVAGIVLFRVRGQNVTEKIKLLEKLLQGYADKLPGRFVVVTKKKIRFMPMEGV